MAATMTVRVGEQIRQVMKAKGISQTALAPRLRISQSTLSKWLRGEVPMTLENLETIAAELEVPVQTLLEEA